MTTTTAVPPAAPTRRPGPTDRQWLVIGLILLAAVLLLAAILTVNHRSGPHAHHLVSAPRDGRSAATFELVTGVGVLTIRTADLGGDLYRASTPDDSNQLPTVDRDNNTFGLRLDQSADGGGNADTVTVLLNQAVRWQIRLAGGTRDTTLDLARGRVSNVDIAAGVGQLHLALPGPQGTVPIQEASGIGQMTVEVPRGTPVAARLSSGAGTVNLAGQNHSGVAAGSTFSIGNYDQATDRYDLECSGGLGNLVVDYV